MPETNGQETTRHTPGPWENTGNGRSVWAKGRVIASTNTENTDGADIANARLIASAPELLSACEAALDWANNSTFATNDFAVKLRAAIQKARGGE